MAKKVFRDAVHNMISLDRELSHGASSCRVDTGDSLLLALIDTPEMQRLRRILQLGPAARVYPSAEHSRFSHALGVMHVAKRMLATLLEHDDGHQGGATFTPHDIVAIKMAALVHDIGHGPYSHVFREMLGGEDHERWGARILTESGLLRDLLERHAPRLDLDPALLCQHVLEILGPGDGLGHQIVASQLDADRMDYLLRDAHFTGVGYGVFDLEWLLHSLRIGSVQGRRRLCVDVTRGMTALESYVMARDDMYRQVYDHKTVRAFEVLLVQVLRTLFWYRQEHGTCPPGTPPELVRFLEARDRQRVTADDFLALDDAVFEYAMGHWSQLPLPDGAPASPAWVALAELRWQCRIWRHRRPLWRLLRWHGSVLDDQGSERLEDPALAQLLADQMERHAGERIAVCEPDGGAPREVPLGLLVHLDWTDRTPYAQLQYPDVSPDPDAPEPDPRPSREPIYVIDARQQVCPAERLSRRIHHLGPLRRRFARIFVDPRAVVPVRAWLQEWCR